MKNMLLKLLMITLNIHFLEIVKILELFMKQSEFLQIVLYLTLLNSEIF